MKKDALLAAALGTLVLFGTSTAASAQSYVPLERPLQVERVPGQDIFYSIGSPGIPGRENEGNTSNAGYVITDEGVAVFDALGTPSLGWALLKTIETQTDKGVRYVILSHYHADHIYGLQAFKDHTSAQIIAQERSVEYSDNKETSDERAETRLDQRKGALFPWVNEATRVVAPDRTFKEKLEIGLGGKRLILLYAGPAHSGSDVMMMVQPDGVLFAGDIVQNGRIPFMNSDEVSTTRWLKALDDILELDPKFIIPGHGRPTTAAKEAIAFTRDYIKFVRGVMKNAVDEWAEFDAAYQAVDWSRYRDLPAFDNNNRGNAYRIYLELESDQFRERR